MYWNVLQLVCTAVQRHMGFCMAHLRRRGAAYARKLRR